MKTASGDPFHDYYVMAPAKLSPSNLKWEEYDRLKAISLNDATRQMASNIHDYPNGEYLILGPNFVATANMLATIVTVGEPREVPRVVTERDGSQAEPYTEDSPQPVAVPD